MIEIRIIYPCLNITSNSLSNFKTGLAKKEGMGNGKSARTHQHLFFFFKIFLFFKNFLFANRNLTLVMWIKIQIRKYFFSLWLFKNGLKSIWWFYCPGCVFIKFCWYGSAYNHSRSTSLQDRIHNFKAPLNMYDKFSLSTRWCTL